MIEVINDPLKWLSANQHHPAQKNYLAMYSSWSNSIVTNPKLMMLPIDDHMVHRGDGVFEALKVVHSKAYLLDAHIDRLFRSLEMIKIETKLSKIEIKKAILRLIEVAIDSSKENDLLIRVYVSRGPGGFGVDPRECVSSQLYVVANRLKALDETVYQSGIKASVVTNLLKDAPWSQVKSCNYLPNVLMKMEANRQGVFLTINQTKVGNIGEGSTENIFIQTQNNEIIYPPFDYTLKGTTLIRLMELIKQNPPTEVSGVMQREISVAELYAAKQVMAVGTTLDVLSVVEVDGRKINQGTVSDFSKWARKALNVDQKV